MQLLFAFIVLSTITLIAVLLMLLSKNTRSGKVREIATQHDWQYQEFIDLSDTIKAANFGLLNYSQNAVFRHIISAEFINDKSTSQGFSFFDCRAIEPLGIHNSSVILSCLNLKIEYKDLHACLTPIATSQSPNRDAMQSPINENYLIRLRRMQKLTLLTPHYAFDKYQLHANKPSLLEQFIQQHIESSGSRNNLSTWLLAHPHLHIEISNGMLLAYQPNRLLDEESIIPAINAVTDISKWLNND